MCCIVLGFFCYCCQQEAGPGPRNEFSKPSENIQLWQEWKLRFSAASLQMLLSLKSVALSRRNSSSLLTSVWPHVKVQPWRAPPPSSSPIFRSLCLFWFQCVGSSPDSFSKSWKFDRPLRAIWSSCQLDQKERALYMLLDWTQPMFAPALTPL